MDCKRQVPRSVPPKSRPRHAPWTQPGAAAVPVSDALAEGPFPAPGADRPKERRITPEEPAQLATVSQILATSPDGIPWALRSDAPDPETRAYDPDGVDATAAEMNASPGLGSDALAADMAELYALALLRHHTFDHIQAAHGLAGQLAAALGQMARPDLDVYAADPAMVAAQVNPRRPAPSPPGKTLPHLLRATLPGCRDGVVLSRLLRPETVHSTFDLAGYGMQAAKVAMTPGQLAAQLQRTPPQQIIEHACRWLQKAGTAPARSLPPRSHPTQLLATLQEGAARAIKTVRRRRINTHLRARPFVLGQLATLRANGRIPDKEPFAGSVDAHLQKLAAARTRWFSLLGAIDTLNQRQQGGTGTLPGEVSYLLPAHTPAHSSAMASQAAVAGCCVTLLKALFEMFTGARSPVPLPDDTRFDLHQRTRPLTLQGELNKLAANIALGPALCAARYPSECRDDLRMGERIAVGLLFEHCLDHTRPVTLRFDDFDGAQIRLSTDGSGCARLGVNGASHPGDLEAWWTRYRP